MLRRLSVVVLAVIRVILMMPDPPEDTLPSSILSFINHVQINDDGDADVGL